MNETEINLDNPFGMEEYVPEEDDVQQALRSVMGTPEGRTVVWGLLEQSKIYNEEFAGNSKDIHDKGRRSVGLWLLAQMNEMDPTAYPRMLLDVARRAQRETKTLATQEQNNDPTG